MGVRVSAVAVTVVILIAVAVYIAKGFTTAATAAVSFAASYSL